MSTVSMYSIGWAIIGTIKNRKKKKKVWLILFRSFNET